MEELVCKSCGNIGHVERMTTDKAGRAQLRAECSVCGAWIKFLDQGKPFIFFFGIYKGKGCGDVPIEYLKWCVEKKVNGYKKIKEYLDGKQNG